MTSVNRRNEHDNFGSTALAVLLVFLLALAGCGPHGPREILLSGPIMGTTYHVKVVATLDGRQEKALAQEVLKVLERVNARMSTYRDDSELSRFNHRKETTPFALSDETLGVFEIALEVSRQTNGAFDVTIGPLVNAWGFGPGDAQSPTDETVTRLRQDVGYHLLTLDREGGTLSKKRPGVYCDLSAVAKGYSVDAVAEALEGAGIHRYMIEVGGEVRTAGINLREEPWRIGIYRPDPERFDVQRVVALSGQSMATSGDYRNFIDNDGQRISHTIDPRTGYPVAHGVASVSVVHASCAWADAYATALMVLPPKEGYAFAEAHDLAAYFIVHDGKDGFTEHMTPAFEAL